jgi:hypothetical protein
MPHNEDDTGPEWDDIYVGFANLPIGHSEFQFARGISLKPTYSHLMSSLTMAFKRPETPGAHHPGPWKHTRYGFSQDIVAELHVPKSAGATVYDRIECALAIAFLIRLWATPALIAPAMANMPFQTLKDASDADGSIVAMEHRQRHLMLFPEDQNRIVEGIGWVRDHFETALRLRSTSAEFMLACHAFDTGQFEENTALVLISLWGALEAFFSPTKTSELRFRVSSLIAAYLKPPGTERRAEQKRVMALYDKRSAAAHGTPSHALDDLFETYQLLRFVLIEHIKR